MSELEYLGSVTELDGRRVICLPVEKYTELIDQRDKALVIIRDLLRPVPQAQSSEAAARAQDFLAKHEGKT